jgi:hypothetical protein
LAAAQSLRKKSALTGEEGIVDAYTSRNNQGLKPEGGKHEKDNRGPWHRLNWPAFSSRGFTWLRTA